MSIVYIMRSIQGHLHVDSVIQHVPSANTDQVQDLTHKAVFAKVSYLKKVLDVDTTLSLNLSEEQMPEFIQWGSNLAAQATYYVTVEIERRSASLPSSAVTASPQ